MADAPQNRRGFFRALAKWAAEESAEIAKPLIEDALERAEPMLTALKGPEVLRPPGALAEAKFLKACEKCHKCIEACPERAIAPADAQIFPEIAGTPVIMSRRRPCYWCKTFHCQEACPSGALLPLAHREMKLGTAKVLPALCLPHNGKPCSTCHTICPLRGEAIEMKKGLPVIHPEACTGCGLCEYACPTHPAAIRVFTDR